MHLAGHSLLFALEQEPLFESFRSHSQPSHRTELPFPPSRRTVPKEPFCFIIYLFLLCFHGPRQTTVRSMEQSFFICISVYAPRLRPRSQPGPSAHRPAPGPWDRPDLNTGVPIHLHTYHTCVCMCVAVT